MLGIIKSRIGAMITIVLWLILITCMIWFIIAGIWWLKATLFYKEIFVPTIIRASMYTFFLVLFWTVLVLLYFRNIKNKKVHVEKGISLHTYSTSSKDANWAWSEMSFTAEIYTKVDVLLDISQRMNAENLSPSQLLSYGALLSHNGNMVKAMGILRMLISNVEAPYRIRCAAHEYLLKLLKYTGKSGIQLYSKIREAEIYE
ncbi:MAG: hypothetical protein ACOYVK_14505 [Bacillota bacterium]